MSMDRRELLKARPGAWRIFQVVTRIDIADIGDARQA